MQHIIYYVHRYFAILLALTLFASCSPNDPSENSSLLRIQLTDTPMIAVENENENSFPDIEIQNLFIDISSIAVLSTDADANEEWKVLNFRGGEYNIFDLTNGRLRQITEQWFPADRAITRIRITFGDNSRIVNTANHAIPLTVPDEAIAEITTEVSINLHAISSIVVQLNTILMHNENEGFSAMISPRAFSETGSSLRGTITPREARASILIRHDEYPIVLRSFVDAQGGFNILGVTPGYWWVSITADPESGWLDSIFVEPVSVTRTPRVNTLSVSLRANVIPPDDDDDDDDDENDEENDEEEDNDDNDE